MYYFRKGLRRCVAEKEANAARLMAEGWEPCSAAIHEALWRRADARQRVEAQPAPALPPITFVIATVGMSREWN